MTDCHSRGDSVWVDDQVWTDAFLSEGHVLLPVGHPNGTLLTMARGKLVTDLWDTDGSHLDLREAVAILVRRQNDLVNHSILRVLQLSGAVLARLEDVGRLSACISSELLAILEHVVNVPDGRALANDDIISVDYGSRIDDAVVVQLVIGAEPHILSLPEVRALKHFIFLLRLRVGSEEGRAEKTPVNA